MTTGGPQVLAVLGPTASGKSAVAHELALRLGGELIVADPFQGYRGLEIAADSPRPRAREAVHHHCVGDRALTERSSAAEFAVRAHAAIDAAIDAGRVPVVSGGTGLYVRAALCELDFPAEPPADVRSAAERRADDDLAGALADLARLDPVRAAAVDRGNPRRVARALAVATAAGGARAPSAGLWTAATRHPTLSVALARDREELDQRIRARVHRELEEGLVAELEAALDTPGLAREPAQIIGMREVAAMGAGDLGRDELAGRLEARTRRLARKQMTWLRKTPGLVTLAVAGEDPAGVAGRVLSLWREAGGAMPRG